MSHSVGDGTTLHMVAPAGGVVAWQSIRIGHVSGVVSSAAAAGELFSLKIQGEHAVELVAPAFPIQAGDKVWADGSGGYTTDITKADDSEAILGFMAHSHTEADKDGIYTIVVSPSFGTFVGVPTEDFDVLRTQVENHETRIDALEAGGGGGGDVTRQEFDGFKETTDDAIAGHETRIDALEAGGGGGGGFSPSPRIILSGMELIQGSGPDAISSTAPYPGNPIYPLESNQIDADTFEWPSRRYAGDAPTRAYVKVLKTGDYEVEARLGLIMYGSNVSGSGMRMQCTVFAPDGTDNFAEHEMLRGGYLASDTDPTANYENTIERIGAAGGSIGTGRCKLRLSAGAILRFRIAGYEAPPSSGKSGTTSIPIRNAPMRNQAGGKPTPADKEYNNVFSNNYAYIFIRML